MHWAQLAGPFSSRKSTITIGTYTYVARFITRRGYPRDDTVLLGNHSTNEYNSRVNATVLCLLRVIDIIIVDHKIGAATVHPVSRE